MKVDTTMVITKMSFSAGVVLINRNDIPTTGRRAALVRNAAVG